MLSLHENLIKGNFVIVYLNFTIHTKDNWTHTAAATTTVAAYHAMNYDKTYFVK